jgi:hypothetical protein
MMMGVEAHEWFVRIRQVSHLVIGQSGEQLFTLSGWCTPFFFSFIDFFLSFGLVDLMYFFSEFRDDM